MTNFPAITAYFYVIDGDCYEVPVEGAANRFEAEVRAVEVMGFDIMDCVFYETGEDLAKGRAAAAAQAIADDVTRPLGDRILAARAAADWDLHEALWEQRKLAEVECEEQQARDMAEIAAAEADLRAGKAAELEGLREDLASAEAHIDRLQAQLEAANARLAGSEVSQQHLRDRVRHEEALREVAEGATADREREVTALREQLVALGGAAARGSQTAIDALSKACAERDTFRVERDEARVREAALVRELAGTNAILAGTGRELERHRAALAVAQDFLDERTDADFDQDGYVPNPEMACASHIEAILLGYVKN
jgi:hypothetical protein